MHSTPVLEARTYSARETATLIGIGYSTLCQAVREGRADHLKPIRVGETMRFPRYHIDAITLGGDV